MAEKTIQDELRECRAAFAGVDAEYKAELKRRCAVEIALDRLTAQLSEARALLRWALTFVTNATDALAQCHENAATGEIDEPEVAEEIAEALAWVKKARAATEPKP